MSAPTRALGPEVNLWTSVNPKPNINLRQIGQFTTAICVCGHRFDANGEPSARMRSRILHTCKLIDDSPENLLVVASGGRGGTSGSLQTEAQLIDRALRSMGYSGTFREEFAAESVGNVAMSYLAFARPFQVPRLVFVTDSPHARRVGVLSKHILKGLAAAETSPASWALSAAEEEEENRREAVGWNFVERFIDEVPPGMPEYAIEWISANHKSNPYLGYAVEEMIAVLQGQILDSNLSALTVAMAPFKEELLLTRR